MNLDKIRKEYIFSEINSEVEKEPSILFKKWLDEALSSLNPEPTAMSLITLGTDGFPQSRIVLLKYFDENGLTFFTNYKSEKGKSMALNPNVGLHFFWPELERQVRISGIAEKTSGGISDTYFNSRPLGSRIAVLASEQSNEIPSRDFLDAKFDQLSKEYRESEPVRPEYWGGYLVKPVKFEFWQGRENRLHDRIIYSKNEKSWIIKRLAP